MSVTTRARILHGTGTVLILLFTLQLAFAVICEFAPPWFRYGHGLYPIFIGRDPISLSNILINVGLLCLALCSFFYADKLARESFFKTNVQPRSRTRDGRPLFSQ